MSIMKKWKERKQRNTRRFRNPGLIEQFLADSTRKVMPINLYVREIHRLERSYPKIAIRKDKQYNNSDLLECTVFKR